MELRDLIGGGEVVDVVSIEADLEVLPYSLDNVNFADLLLFDLGCQPTLYVFRQDEVFLDSDELEAKNSKLLADL